ncbi:hypothetical protein ACWGQ5_39080 [Streptomyces sp. NPDC055722]
MDERDPAGAYHGDHGCFAPLPYQWPDYAVLVHAHGYALMGAYTAPGWSKRARIPTSPPPTAPSAASGATSRHR